MPRVIKTKAGTTGALAGGGVAKKVSAPKRNKLYAMPEKIAEGTILTDLSKGQWSIGSSIGTGGFGEIYSACRLGEKNYNYVVKCEPHGNGPLFVEMHFYMRNAKLEDIKRFQRDHGLKTLGMPYMIGNGSVELQGIKHRFIVLPRYGSDIQKHFLANGRRLPEGTIYRLALQMLDVYEFIHSCGYIHADLKAANILLGYGKDGNSQAYLVDYGLASHYTTKEFKPDPKKMHNGTIEYTSRDAHLGVATMRADFEILGYNIIEWSGAQLPWVRSNLLTAPAKVQKAKEEFIADVDNCLKTLYPKGVPVSIAEYMKYVAKMKYDEKPDYEKCRKIFISALKIMKIPNSGELKFTMNGDNNNPTPSTSKARSKVLKKRTSVEMCASDDDDDDVIFEEKKPVKKAPQRPLKTIAKRSPRTVASPTKPFSPVKNASPRKHISTLRGSPETKSISKSTAKAMPDRKRRSSSFSPAKVIRSSPLNKKAKTTPHETDNGHRTRTPNTSNSHTTRSTPIAARANINFSPAISLSTSRPGKTIVNDNTTPVPRTGKTYEFNFELDVSMDANVIVNVKRKKKAAAASKDGMAQSSKLARSNGQSTTQRDSAEEKKSTPVTRVKVRKLPSDDASDSPRTPAVTVKKSRRVVS
ncbi:nucleosomal histone kinase 1 isoform X1 [Anastrepha ludens]|uniref:nucleosomal histone kinase 1 isoform X1 n=1 Tax=Anastrepha ludens TaxID=28586 RepID=UPI0023B0B398|nr:nucleosomal histone kinase 1 isoform X1 [Anastrepha ludens]